MASPLSSKSARPTPNCECVSCGISFHTANPEQDACPRCLLTPKQRDINHRLLSAPKRHTLLYGGARSGKTVLFVRAIMMRAIHAPETRHAMLRLRANAARASLWLDTLPKVQRVFFPKFTLRDHRQDGYVEIVESGSQIWIAGTDDKERIEKILGQEFLTIYLNECSQIPYSTVLTVLTRLAQTHPEVVQKAFYDLNPVGTRHYTSMLFVQGRDPLTQIPILDAHQRQYSFINPQDNRAFLTEEFLQSLQAVPDRQRRRFYEGIYQAEIDGALWTFETIELARCLSEDVPRDLKREGWARVAVTTYREFKVDRIVAEQNFGGDMVRAVLHTVDRNVPVNLVNASRGKTVRAEPVSALYGYERDGSWHKDQVRHAGEFRELEDQMLNFSTAGYLGDRSPDRVDALVWALTDLLVEPEPGAAMIEFYRMRAREAAEKKAAAEAAERHPAV